MKRFLVAMLAAFALTACVTVPADAAPANFQLHDMQPNGGVYDSNAYLGKPMVIEFYFNGCHYCNDNVRNFDVIVASNYPAKAQVISVSVDEDRSEYDAWIRNHHPITPLLNDSANEEVIGFFGVHSYPTAVVLDKNHNLLFRTVGVWTQATQARIQRLINENQ